MAAFVGLGMVAGYIAGCFVIETILCRPRDHGKPEQPELTPEQRAANAENERTRQVRLWGRRK